MGETLTNGLSGRRILVVEDEVIVAWALEDMLAEMGCAIVGPAARVNQALAMIDDESIDAVVLDLNLNGQMSYPVADVLASRGVPFVFLTGYHKSSIPEAYVGGSWLANGAKPRARTCTRTNAIVDRSC